MTELITWDDVHALPIAAMDAKHKQECKYYDYQPCSCGVIPVPPNEGLDDIGFHAYVDTTKCCRKMASELTYGPKTLFRPHVFVDDDVTHQNILENIALATSAYSDDFGNYLHEDVMVHGFIYLLRIRELFTRETSYKLLITAMFVANKYHSEQAKQMGMFDAFVRAAGVFPSVLRVWEVEFLKVIRHRLYVSPYEFYAFRKMYVD